MKANLTSSNEIKRNRNFHGYKFSVLLNSLKYGINKVRKEIKNCMDKSTDKSIIRYYFAEKHHGIRKYNNRSIVYGVRWNHQLINIFVKRKQNLVFYSFPIL